MIAPRAIAQGDGDEYLIRLKRSSGRSRCAPTSGRMGEPNRCLNVYASYDCVGGPRDDAHRPIWYRRAFRRMYVILHGGGKRRVIDAAWPRPACRR